MTIDQIYTGCLKQGAYYIESEGEVAIIDPLREIDQYIKKAEDANARIKYVFETHFHADFVSGHVTLAKETGAPIIYGPTANPEFEAIIAKDGQQFKLGKLVIEALHTPGHTMESTTYLLKDENGKNHAIFSGDTLFLGDVGRPDLAQKAADMTKEELAGLLFDSLREKIMPLEDDVIVYPAHGAGSACGKKMMKETLDTLGNQKEMNYALRADMSKEEFIKEVTDGLLPPPKYFPLNVMMNREGYKDIAEVIEKGTTQLSPDAFEAAANETGAIVLDVRHHDDFVASHIPSSIYVGLHGDFAPWVGALIADVEQPILLVTPEGKEEEAVTRLSRVGFDNTLGFLEGGFQAWVDAGKEVDSVESAEVSDILEILKDPQTPVFDVRKPPEYEEEHFEIAQNTPLDFINDHLAEYPTNGKFYVHCAGGFRSVIAASILKSRGIHNLVNILGGYEALKEGDLDEKDFVSLTPS